MTTTRILAALSRFHLAGGVRLCLRATVPMVGVGVAAVGIQAEPAAALAAFCRAVAGPGFDSAVAACELGLAGLIASWARHRLAPAQGSWIRHLPASGSTHRLALIIGFIAVQTPLLLAVALAAIATSLSGNRIGIARIGFLVLAVLVVAWRAAPAETAGSRTRRRVWSVGGHPGGSDGIHADGRGTVLATTARIASRAVGWRRLGPLVYGLVPLLGCLILSSNNQLAMESAARVARFSACLSAALLVAGLSEQLGWLRPAWPWARSLPWSSGSRVAADAWFLGLHAAPLLAVAALLDWRGGLAGLLVTPLLAARGAGFLRSALGSRAGASGRVLIEGFLIAGLSFLWWPATMMLAAAAPWALRRAAGSERDQRVTRWVEMGHLAEGDPASWSGR